MTLLADVASRGAFAMREITSPAALAAYLLRRPTQVMREAIAQYEAGYLTIGELESKLLFLVEKERELSATRERQADE